MVSPTGKARYRVGLPCLPDWPISAEPSHPRRTGLPRIDELLGPIGHRANSFASHSGHLMTHRVGASCDSSMMWRFLDCKRALPELQTMYKAESNHRSAQATCPVKKRKQNLWSQTLKTGSAWLQDRDSSPESTVTPTVRARALRMRPLFLAPDGRVRSGSRTSFLSQGRPTTCSLLRQSWLSAASPSLVWKGNHASQQSEHRFTLHDQSFEAYRPR